ncbi:MAG: hypothetical protein JRH13_12675 [Deltaproteobacteria bacterium]|nr:hypothetical protein [Deltaproteobacteria bacterium]MBW2017399.1 hypothetical protein [Deltaproteobacteria bacterium]MBW2130207.1 hypothetical protein [Deltaproteobacteria bacterium]MBW2302960.1 hypothetical protein [Deltaproteobacteria bacterium]
MNPTGFQIEHQCPQCGAPVILQETDRLLTCGFCRVKSFLVSRDVFRYVLPHRVPEGKELLYVPYWRFKGMAFSCLNEGIRHRIIDISRLALPSPFFPPSLGLRTQTLKLRFLASDTGGVFLKSRLSHEDFIDFIERQTRESLPTPLFLQSFIGESLSQIYAPFYVDSRIYDGVLNRPLVQDPPEDFDKELLKGPPPGWRIRFVPALCPVCGWDLEGDRDSLILVCRNCKSAWQAGKGTFQGVKAVHLPVEGGEVSYLPFYRINAEVRGIQLASYADLVKAANLPKAPRPEWAEIPFRFWFPAFKVRPLDLLRFSSHLTLGQPREKFSSGFPEGRLHPVTLSIREAVEGLKMTLADFLKPAKTMYPMLSGIQIIPQSYLLVYIPFRRRGNELYQSDYRLRINRNLLAFARHL